VEYHSVSGGEEHGNVEGDLLPIQPVGVGSVASSPSGVQGIAAAENGFSVI